MRPFTTHTGLVAPMDRSNVDTDQIIPKQFLKRVERTGFGQFLFFDYRYRDDGSNNPDFVLNRPEYAGASVLLARSQFRLRIEPRARSLGIGGLRLPRDRGPQLRRHFLQQLFQEWPVADKLDEAAVTICSPGRAAHPGYKLTVDLEKCLITDSFGLSLEFEVDAFRRHCMLHGLDDIGLTLEHEAEIAAYEHGPRHRPTRMKELSTSTMPPVVAPAGRWHDLADRVLDGHRLTPEEGLGILLAADEELLDLLAAAYRVRHRWFGNRVDLNFLINAKSGLCGEDCGYCSQSRVSRAEIPRYRPGHGRADSRRRPNGRRAPAPRPIAWSSPAARPAIRNSTRSARSSRKSRPPTG